MSGSRILPGSLPLPAPASPRERALNGAISNIYDVLARRLRDEIQTGLLADRPTSSGAPRFFYATDSVELYFDTSSGWVLIANGAAPPAPSVTGTGFWHETAGSLDAAAKLVDTADVNNDQITYAKMQNVSTTHRVLGRDGAAPGDVEELAISTVLDWISSTQGVILYRSASGWAALATGTDGKVLTTHGAAADPTWETPSAASSLTVTDGSTTVDPVTDIEFTAGATVTDGGGGLAQIAIASGTGAIIWKVGSLTTMLSTELNSLGSGSATAVGTEYDNSSNLYMFADFELNVTFGTGPTASTPVNIYLIPALDGTNYASGSSSVLPANTGIGSFLVLNSTSAQRLMLRGIVIPPCKFKIIAENATNQAFPSSGSTVKMLPYGEQMN